MTALYPFTFHPIFKERVWGGRNLERLYGKSLPVGGPIGESWEISDRLGDVSVIANGPLKGKDLRWLMEHHERELLGSVRSQSGRFPLLIKLLDAQETLSLQVHPPTDPAGRDRFGGEPKTEMWYVADAAPRAELFVGLRRGITRNEFERKLQAGTVAECFHRLSVKRGDAMFLPSGRVHAIGAGLVLFEIQQNSDTTYRVFDWNRVGLDGKPRDLHIAQSLASIDFNDFEPKLVGGGFSGPEPTQTRPLVRPADAGLFSVEHSRLTGTVALPPNRMQIIGALSGEMRISGGAESVKMRAGQFCLVPAALQKTEVSVETPAEFLRVEAG